MEKLSTIDWMFNTDKSSLCHGYTEKYERYLPFDRDQEITILEIGVLGGESLKMWRYWFRMAYILGIDSNPECTVHADPHDGVYVYTYDQAKTDELKQLGEDWLFDLIIDDGSHINTHQITTFETLFPLMAAGGMYVIEDTHTSYWSQYGGGLKKPGTCVEYFKDMIDQINFNGELLNIPEAKGNTHYRRDDWMLQQFQGRNPIGNMIYSINFMNSLIFIQKR